MIEVHQEILKQALKNLTTIKCSFKVITPDGEEFGDLEVVKKKERKRSPPKYPFGTVRNMYKDQINLDIPLGEPQYVDCGDLDPKTVQSNVQSYLGEKWGKASSKVVLVGKTIQICRLN